METSEKMERMRQRGEERNKKMAPLLYGTTFDCKLEAVF